MPLLNQPIKAIQDRLKKQLKQLLLQNVLSFTLVVVQSIQTQALK
jgi:hypothetical protein